MRQNGKKRPSSFNLPNKAKLLPNVTTMTLVLISQRVLSKSLFRLNLHVSNSIIVDDRFMMKKQLLLVSGGILIKIYVHTLLLKDIFFGKTVRRSVLIKFDTLFKKKQHDLSRKIETRTPCISAMSYLSEERFNIQAEIATLHEDV